MQELNEKQIKAIEKIIRYKFNDPIHLNRALTHPSFRSEDKENYQQLEFLGDAIVNFVVTYDLFFAQNNLDKSEFIKLKDEILSQKMQADIVKRLKLDKYILVDPKDKEMISEKNKADVFEWIIAAMFLDSSDFDIAANFMNTGLWTQKKLVKLLFDVLAEEGDCESELSKCAFKTKLKLSSNQIKKIETDMGYKFENPNYLSCALTHPEVNLENRPACQHLEFLGGAIFKLITALELFYIHKNTTGFDKDEVTGTQSIVASDESLALMVDVMGFKEHILKEPLNELYTSEENKADIFKAMVGAIFVDSRSLNKVMGFVDLSLEKGAEFAKRHM